MTPTQSRSIHSVAIENLGCAKNQVDAEYLISLLADAGYRYVENPASADAIIVNSCGFINPAKEESINTTLELREQYPAARIVLAGCLAQRYGRDIDLPEADAIVGNRDLSAVIEAIRELEEDRRPVLLPEGKTGEIRRSTLLSMPGSAYLKIAEGCDNRCSFCAIPLIRGPVVSRAIDTVVAEAEDLISKGIHEINLVAQDLSSFGRDRGVQDLPELLDRLSALEGDFWIRLLYIHPDRFPAEIIPILKRDSRILPYFDIPFQHASPRILKAMGRRGSAEGYLGLIEEIRTQLPDAVFRTTFLIGYPGETNEDLDLLADFMRRGQFLWAGFFVYSPEDGTPAAATAGGFKAMRSRRRAEKRKAELEELQSGISREVLTGFIGRELEILVEEPVAGEELAISRAYLNAPEVDGAVVLHGEELKTGQVVKAKLVALNGIDLEAQPVLG